LPHPVIADLQGRNVDVFEAADGRLVHGSALGKALQAYVGEPGLGAVRLMRFEQMDTRRWKLTVESDFEPDVLLQAQAQKLVQSLFGKSCSVEVSSVMFLPRESSGKFRYYRPAARSMQPIRLTASDE